MQINEDNNITVYALERRGQRRFAPSQDVFRDLADVGKAITAAPLGGATSGRNSIGGARFGVEPSKTFGLKIDRAVGKNERIAGPAFRLRHYPRSLIKS